MSRKGPTKAKSVDDMDALKNQEEEIEPKISSNVTMNFPPSVIERLTMKHLEMIANRTKTLQRKMTKTRSSFY